LPFVFPRDSSSSATIASVDSGHSGSASATSTGASTSTASASTAALSVPISSTFSSSSPLSSVATSAWGSQSSAAAVTTSTIDPNFAHPTGLVTLLLLSDQATGIRGTFLEDAQAELIASVASAAAATSTSSTTAAAASTTTSGKSIASSTSSASASSSSATSPLKIGWRVFPEDQGYSTYADELRAACDGGVGGLYDVVFVENSRVGEFADCLVDLLTYDANATSGFIPAAVNNSMYKNSLVVLPLELDFGVLLYNQGLLGRYGLSGPPKNFDEMEDMINTILINERTMDNYGVSGIAGSFGGETLTTMMVEWLAGRRNTSLLNLETSEPNVLTLPAAEALAHAASWVDSGFINSDDLSSAPTPGDSDPFRFAPVVPPDAAALAAADPAFARFAAGQAVFLRHWAHALPAAAEAAQDSSLNWDVAGVVGVDDSVSVGALGGWSAGVYKYSQNPASAARVV
ncbi:hypothetical protein HK405_011301, partial [Cladochytrium tenue]